ncbi:hypothetical protein [Tropicimonas sp.]|uniref:hypothetical protein n=1 Tax=Tropicimonas sp. TaxID=2067044 RepID=UPI003A83B40E
MSDSSAAPVLATIEPSAARRVLGIVVLFALGGTLIYLGLARPPDSLPLQAFLLALGAAVLALGNALRQATANRLELTHEVLRESTGRVVARVDRIVAVERGAFAIKPSNGFLLRLSGPEPDGNRWAPGLWWRLGRRVGVGGITSAGEGKAVAELLSAMIAERSA